MSDVKLTDFTRDELKTLHIAIDMCMIHCGQTFNDKEKEALDLWRTQIMNASVAVKIKENIQSN